ncbi:MAG: hypothetical protein JXB45_06790 [Candidatus Krumholzibacteriota bacterium]|nr:hypothetical protein [Candidatus Krumholzibacteriota bacterium]
MGDERFIAHRYQATRLSMLVGLVLMLVFFNYDLLIHKLYRWDLLIIILATALVKVVTMLFLRRYH